MREGQPHAHYPFGLSPIFHLHVLPQFPQTRALFEKTMASLICEGNVCRVFATAHLHSMDRLKECAAQYMCEHPQVVTLSRAALPKPNQLLLM